MVCVSRFKIGGRIVKRQVAVFANPNQCDIDRTHSQRHPGSFADRNRIGHAIQIMEGTERYPIDESLLEVAAKRGAMRCGDSDVFIQVESVNSRPIDERL